MHNLNGVALLSLALCQNALAWSTEVETTTESINANTQIFSATNIAYAGTTYTLAALTTTQAAEQLTQTITRLAVPTWAAQAHLGKEALAALLEYGTGLSTVDPATLSKFNADIMSAYNCYTSATPPPAIISQFPNNLLAVVDRLPSGSPPLESFLVGVDPYATSGHSYSDLVTSALSPYPAIQTQYQQYLTTAASYNAPAVLQQYTIAMQDLGVTSKPAFLSVVSSFLPSSTGSASVSGSGSMSMTTSTSTGSATSATPTIGGAPAFGKADILVSAGIAAAGVAVVAMM